MSRPSTPGPKVVWEGPLAGVSSEVSCPMLRRMASPVAWSLMSCCRSILPALAWTHTHHATRGLAGSEEAKYKVK